MIDTAVVATCRHHWRIEERVLDERYSHGRCINCGIERDFDNWALEDQPRVAWKDLQQASIAIKNRPRLT